MTDIPGLPKTKEEFIASLSAAQEAHETVASEVADSLSYTGDQSFQGRLQVAALGSPQSRFMKITFFCRQPYRDGSPCGNLLKLDFQDAEMRPSPHATYFDTNNPLDALKVLSEAGPLGNGCGHPWKFWEVKGEEERAVTSALVLARDGTEGKAWFVHGPGCDLRRGPNWIRASGWLCRGKMGKIGIIVKSFTSESEVQKPGPEDEADARAYLRFRARHHSGELRDSLVWRTAEALARDSQLKGGEVVRGFVSDLLTVASPVWVKTPEGPRQLGITTCELGPTTAAKSQRERKTVEWLSCGKYVTGRQTVAGLTAGAEKIEGGGWILRKGLLPSMDLSWAIFDNMPPRSLDSQIESRRDGVVTINAIRSAELWARTRLKLLSNPSQPFDETLYKCTLLKVYDPKLVARFCFALYTYGVSLEERYDPNLAQPESEDEKLLASVSIVLRANLSRETTFTVPEGLWPRIMQYGKLLEEKYGCEDIPLVLRSVPYKLSLLAHSFAVLEGCDLPEESQVTLAYKWLDYCAQDIELDKYVVWWKTQHLLSEEDYASTAVQIESTITEDLREHGGTKEETYAYKLIEYLAKNETCQRDELAAYLNVDPKTVSRKSNVLKGLGLLRSDMEGYHFTARGVRFFKRWLHVPNVPGAPGSNGKGTQLEGVSVSKTGGIRDTGDIKQDSQPAGNRGLGVGVSSWTENPPLLHPKVPRPAASPSPADSSLPVQHASGSDGDSAAVTEVTHSTSVGLSEGKEGASTPTHTEGVTSVTSVTRGQLPLAGSTGFPVEQVSRLREFILQDILPQAERRIGYATTAQILYSCQDKFGVTVSLELVTNLLHSLAADGLVFQLQPGCWKLEGELMPPQVSQAQVSKETWIFITCTNFPWTKHPSYCCQRFPHYEGRVVHCKAHCEFYRKESTDK